MEEIMSLAIVIGLASVAMSIAALALMIATPD